MLPVKWRILCALLREVYKPFLDMSPGMVALEDCGSLFSHFRHQKTVAERCLVR